MCGISGVFNYSKKVPVLRPLMKDMCASIHHRGPDEEGMYFDDQAGLAFGHRRLSIIDLATGQQPMSDSHKKIWIVFNGEIYNFKELREELISKGRVFRTKSDTEVILQLYDQYGPQAFNRLNGIFAFAIYDQTQQKVFLARDHFGVKPVYYWSSNGRFVFSSEIKAILKDPQVNRELDLGAFDTYLTLRYNPSPQTLFKGIHKVIPGSYMEISVQGVRVHTFTNDSPRINRHIKEKDAVFTYKQLLEAAVKRQMVSDVPVGLFLSGGVDSAVLGYLMQKHYGNTINTFSIGFEGTGDYNELSDAQATAKLINSQHHSMVITKKEYLDYYCRSFLTIEEPIAETTIPALYYVAKLASEHLKVVLAGQGADEPMAGYHRYLGAHFIGKYEPLLKMLPLSTIASILPRNERFKRAVYVTKFRNEQDRLKAIYTIFTDEQKAGLYSTQITQQINRIQIERLKTLYDQTGELSDFLSKILYIDTRMSLPDNLLLFNDKVTMANSLEMRVPFLDTELIAFLETLPSDLKLRGKIRKYIHKKAVEDWLPKEIIHRKKRGFATPMDSWLQSDFGSKVQEILNAKDSASRIFFNIQHINEMIKLHQNRKENYQRHIFMLLSFELWYQTFFQNKDLSGDMFDLGVK